MLDQRRFKTDPAAPDTAAQDAARPARSARWLLRTLAASQAPFKVICSPCTLAPVPANAPRRQLGHGLHGRARPVARAHRRAVAGRTLFVTGDTHWTMAYERDGLFEARPCPLGIPTPNDITLTSAAGGRGRAQASRRPYADDDKGHFALLDVTRRHATSTSRSSARTARGRSTAASSSRRRAALRRW